MLYDLFHICIIAKQLNIALIFSDLKAMNYFLLYYVITCAGLPVVIHLHMIFMCRRVWFCKESVTQ